MELGKKGWTISDETVDTVLEQAAITADQDYILVLQCLDKGISLKWTGNSKWPKKGLDGKVHIAGRITLARIFSWRSDRST